MTRVSYFGAGAHGRRFAVAQSLIVDDWTEAYQRYVRSNAGE